MTYNRKPAALAAALFLFSILPISSFAQAEIERISVSFDGTQGDSNSAIPSISVDGRYVVFESDASNLVPFDTNGTYDIFVHDRQSHTTERVSVASDGTQGDSGSGMASISADGRYVVFGSFASNLVADDTNENLDLFVHDRLNHTTERVSVASDGTQGNEFSDLPSISADGRFVGFFSYATNLVPSDTNERPDVFVHDRLNHTTERVSVASDGTQGDDFSESFFISADGRFVGFLSNATNLVPGDTNGLLDVFVHDRQSHTTERVSVASDGTQGNDSSYYSSFSPSSISADGRYVVFESAASNLVPSDTNDNADVFVHDRLNHATELISVASDQTQGNALSHSPSISADGRFVIFFSDADNFVPGDTNGIDDVFVHDRLNHTTDSVGIAPDGTQRNAFSYSPSISADGHYVAFSSYVTNLVPGDTNNAIDIFVTENPLFLNGSDPIIGPPTDKNQCKKSGWKAFNNPVFKNQGKCVSYVNHH